MQPDKLTDEDRELMRLATEQYNAGMAVLNFASNFLRNKYRLQEGDRILPDGTVERVQAALQLDATLANGTSEKVSAPY